MTAFRSVLLIALSIALLPTTRAAPRAGARAPSRAPSRAGDELAVRASVRAAEPPSLTTAKVRDLDPSERNPHRRRFVVERKVVLDSLAAYARPDGRYGLRTLAVDAKATTWVRPNGPWYHSLAEFPCARTYAQAPWWVTEAAAREGAAIAARAWHERLADHRLELAMLLARVAVSTEDNALKAAQLVFANWLREQEQDWRARDLERAQTQAWEADARRARELQVCAPKAPVASAPPPESMMEAPGPVASPMPVEIRAPARRWDGRFTVRASIKVGDKKFVGQFLVDSGADRSVLSPIWLKAQGIPAPLIEIPGLKPERVRPSRVVRAAGQGGGGFAHVAVVDELEVSGRVIPIQEFVVLPVELFNPPLTVGSCCDGVLGADFFATQVVQLSSKLPHEVRLFDPDGFNGGPDHYWVEASLVPGQGPISGCQSTGARAAPLAIRWDTAQPGAFEVAAGARAISKGVASCLGSSFVGNLPAGVIGSANGPWSATEAATTAGLPLLSQTGVIFDLPNGRVWLPRPEAHARVYQDRSGIELKYALSAKGDRELRVSALRRGTAADALLKQGLAIGTVITKIDDRVADEIDLSEVHQRLSGEHGPSVKIEWIHRHDPKTVVVPLMDR